MKIIAILLAFYVLATASPAKSKPHANRRFLPEENDPYRVKYLLYTDEDGKLHFEDLTLTVTEKKVTEDDVTLYLYTQKNVNDGFVFKPANLVDLENSKVYDPKKPNYFIIHGLNNNYKSSVNTVLKAAILKTTDCNVFVVDWKRLANKLYLTAKNSVPKIGEHVGDFINKMMDHYELTPKDFKLIGHSLGAHVAGCAGAKVNGLVDYIIGLDPAGPLFTISNTDNRLDEGDAEFVQIIHTSGSKLGFGSSIGNADFYPNNGESQPGCGIDLVGTCAHSRAYYYLEESILNGGFASVKCDNYKSFKRGECDNNHSSYLGSLKVDVTADGDYYLNTDRSSPFSLD